MVSPTHCRASQASRVRIVYPLHKAPRRWRLLTERLANGSPILDIDQVTQGRVRVRSHQAEDGPDFGGASWSEVSQVAWTASSGAQVRPQITPGDDDQGDPEQRDQRRER